MVAAVTIRKSGKAEMAYLTGEVPWHSLGNNLDRNAPIENWIDAAGFDFEILSADVQYAAPNGEPFKMGDRRVLYRSDDCSIALGVVSPGFKVVQPRETLEFFRDLVAKEGYCISTAGTLFDGKRYWALAETGESATIRGKDTIRRYVLLATACDGTMKTVIKDTNVRVVCNNTLELARKLEGATTTFSHRSKFNADLAKEKAGLVQGQISFKDHVEQVKELANRKVSSAEAAQLFEDILVGTKFISAKEPAKTAPFQGMVALFNGKGLGSNLLSAEGTAWGAVNAVTQFVDHEAKSTTPSHRLSSAWFGRGNELKLAAFDKALELLT